MPALIGPQLTWTNIVATVVAMTVLAGGGYKIIEAQFEYVRQSAEVTGTNLGRSIELNRRELELIRSEFLTLREHTAYLHEQEGLNTTLKARVLALETEQREMIQHAARNPIEAREVDQLVASIDKRFEAAQQQINDINRQIAASILPGHPVFPNVSPGQH